jgi:hypothetical protein
MIAIVHAGFAAQPRRLASARQEDAVSRRCVNESMRLYPHPPVLLRRSLVPDELPGALEAERPASTDHHDLDVVSARACRPCSRRSGG